MIGHDLFTLDLELELCPLEWQSLLVAPWLFQLSTASVYAFIAGTVLNDLGWSSWLTDKRLSVRLCIAPPEGLRGD